MSEVDAGGVLSLMRVYTAEQERRGHEVHLLAPEPMGMPEGRWHHWPIDRRRPHTFPGAIARLREVVRQVEPDVTHLHSFFAGVCGRVVPRALPGSTAVVYQPHSWAFDAVDHRWLRNSVVGWERYAARRTDFLVGNCAEEIQEGHDHGVCIPSRALGLPVDTAVFSPPDATEREALRTRNDFDTRVVALCVGRLSRQKAQDRLVAAWEQDPVPDTLLVLVGSGDDTPLRALAPTEWGRSIRSVGHQDDIRSWLRSGDMLIQSSRYEGQSVAVAEALACGLPVIAMDVNGSHDAIEAGPLAAAGSVVAQGDVQRLLKELAARVADPLLLQRESIAARERAVELFAAEAVIDVLDGAYAEARRLRSKG